MKHFKSSGLSGTIAFAIAAGTAAPATANDKLIELAKNEENWVMQCKNYHCDHYSTQDQIDTSNVKDLRPAWSFSTGLLNGHEGAPLVIGDMMYIHTSFPNYTYAVNLNDPGAIIWEHKPKLDPAARAVACCDLVNRGLAYWPGDGATGPRIIKSQLDGHLVALDAKTGQEVWKVEVMDIAVGQTLTQAPYVVKDHAIIGSSGAELGVRGVVTSFNIKTGEMEWRWYATGPDKEIGLADDFNGKVPHYGQKGLGTATWEGETWKIGGGTNWGWYAYDPDLNLIYYGSGNPSPWNETMRPGDNKSTMTLTARDVDTGLMKWGYQKTPHDEWDYAGINVMMLSEQKDKTGKMRKLVTHPDRNGVVYTLDRESGELISADFLDDTVNVFKKVDLKTGLPVRDPEFNTRMDHRTKDACPSAMGYHNQGLDSYDPEKRLFFMGINHLCMDWEPFMLPYRAGQFFVGANVWTYPGPKGDKAAGVGSGQVKAYNAISGDYEWEKMERFAVWGGTLATKGDLVFYGTLDGFIKARNSNNGDLLWKFKIPSGAIGHPITYTHKGTQYVGIMYGVGGWPGVGLVFDLKDPSAGLGAVGAFKELAKYTQMGGGFIAFALDGKGPYSDPTVGEYAP